MHSNQLSLNASYAGYRDTARDARPRQAARAGRAFVNTSTTSTTRRTSAPRGAAAVAGRARADGRGRAVSEGDLRRAIDVREGLRAVLLANNGRRARRSAPWTGWTAPPAGARLRRALHRPSRPGARARRAWTAPWPSCWRSWPTREADGTWERLKACAHEPCSVGLLRPVQEPLQALVPHGDLRQRREGPRLPGPPAGAKPPRSASSRSQRATSSAWSAGEGTGWNTSYHAGVAHHQRHAARRASSRPAVKVGSPSALREAGGPSRRASWKVSPSRSTASRCHSGDCAGDPVDLRRPGRRSSSWRSRKPQASGVQPRAPGDLVPALGQLHARLRGHRVQVEHPPGVADAGQVDPVARWWR